MNFEWSEDQLAIADLAGRIFSEQVTDEYHRQRASGADPALWRLLAESGLTGACLPEAVGGSEMGQLELALMLEAQGRSLAPVPLGHSSVASLARAEFGAPAEAQRWLPGVVEGSYWLSAALHEVAAGAVAPFRCRPVGEGWELSGQAEQVGWAKGAGALLVPARAEDDTLHWLMLPIGAEGVRCIAQEATHPEPRCRVVAEGVRLDATARLAVQGEELTQWLLSRLRVALAALTLGVVEEALARTADYTMERQQLGRPLAAFQAVAHRAAEGYVDREALRTVLWSAAWRLDSDQPDAAADALTAKWWAAEAAHRIGHTGQHLHGGIGADLDYPIHRYYLWAKGLEFSLGGGGQQLAELGRQLAANAELGARLR